MALATSNPPPSSPWSSSSQPPLPCLALPDGSFFPFPSSTSLTFPNAAGYHGSSSDYLIFTVSGDDVSGDGYYLLVNPFTGDTVRLPSLSRIRFVVNSGMALPWRNIADDQRAPYGETTTVRKVVMCPRGELIAAMVGDGKLGKIAMCRHRHGDEGSSSSSRWVMSGHDAWRWFDDIAFYDGKVYAVDDAGSLFAMDTGVDNLISEPEVAWAKIVIKVSDDSPPTRRRRRKEKAAPSMRYLLVSGGKLMMVHRAAKAMSDGGRTKTTTKFEVFKFKADLVSPRWVKMTSIGDDVAIFVGRWFSFALRVWKYKLPGNRIHFLDDDAFRRHCCPDDKFGSYDMADSKIYPLIVPPSLELCNGAGGSLATWLFPRPCPSQRGLPRLAVLHAATPSPATVGASTFSHHGGATVAHLALPNGMIFSYPELTSRPFHKNAAGGSYLAAACDDWLLFSDADGLFRLTSPFTGKTMLLPSFHNVHVDDRPVEIINEPSPSHESPSTTTTTTGELWRNDGDETMAVKKLVICPDGIVAAIFGREHFSKLVLCSSETFSWTHSVHDRWRRYDDLAFHGGKLYAVTGAGDLLAIDVGVDAETGEPSITRVERVIEGATILSSFHYLVLSGAGGELLMVRRRFPYDVLRRTMLVVFRADLASSRWVEMGNLGGGGRW
nr:unnamed protein product [Digitaria exilis]